MITVPTYWARIFVGVNDDYGARTVGPLVIDDFLRAHVTAHPRCVSVTQTHFVYTDGDEPGFEVGMINYPRFPNEPSAIRAYAIDLARKLKTLCRQHRVTVMFPDTTVMLEDGE
jgi:hypothetical protein